MMAQMSHPLRVRELKPNHFVGFKRVTRRTLYGCVNWNINIPLTVPTTTSRTLYGCVNWNDILDKEIRVKHVAPFTGAWIETDKHTRFIIRDQVAPFTGAWIETHIYLGEPERAGVAPFTGAWIETPYSITCPQVSKQSHPLRVRELKLWWKERLPISPRRTLYGCVNWNLWYLSSMSQG